MVPRLKNVKVKCKNVFIWMGYMVLYLIFSLGPFLRSANIHASVNSSHYAFELLNTTQLTFICLYTICMYPFIVEQVIISWLIV